MPKKENSPEREYNYIYEKLVKDSTDFTGMVAYGLYKKEKILYLKKLQDKNGKITDDNVRNYHISSEIRLENYEKDAVIMINDFISDVVDRKVKMSKELITDIVEKKAGPSGMKNWARVITQNIAAAFIYSVAIYLLLIFIWFKNSGNENNVRDKILNTTQEILHINPLQDSINLGSNSMPKMYNPK